ncbi:hypothetical protein HID58_075041 [Brassica napus]|uniref:Uncharacterized protein n=1 Tax=Brassica napus TaxID=3708 RepID=A0ABQ7YJR2_BRANA|nr:hypothetical protein HID58_075041 [Brassica napus]
MEGSPYRKSSISWKGGLSLGLVPGFLLAGTWSVPLSGARGSGSCPEAGGNDTGVFFSNSLSLIARFRHRTQSITNALKSTGVAHSQQAPLRQDSALSVSLSLVPLKPELILSQGKDWFHLIWLEPNTSVLNFLKMTRLERVLVRENRSLRYALESLGPEKKRKRPPIPRDSLSRMDSLFDACKASLGFSVLSLRFCRQTFSVSFSLATKISRDLHISVRVFTPHAEWGLSPDSSSIGSRVRSSKVKDAVAPSVSIDSSDSSLDLTAEVEDPKAIVAQNVSPVAEGNRYPPIGPPSVIGVEDVADWRMKYNLPADVIIRVSGPEDRVSDFGVDEVPVYEGYFESGFMDRVPSLVAKISETLEIYPGQLNPPAWRTLIALQNLGDLQGLVIGVAEVLCSYYVSPLSGAEWRYYLRPRGKEPPVREIPKRERKHLPRVDYSSGRETIEWVLRLPIERRQIPFLVSKAALMRCSIWGEMSGSKRDEALAEYKKDLEVMSARKSAPKRTAFVDDDEVQFLRSSKRLTVAATALSSSKKKSKASGSSPSASYDWTTVLTKLNTKVFPSTPVLFALEEDSSVAIQSLQGDLLQVASQLFHLGERMVGAASTKAEMDALASQLREEKDVALAKDKEIRALRLKVRNQEEVGALEATENVSLRGQLKNREEDLNDLKDTAETFEAEKAMAVNGAMFVARWELMREWLNGQTDSWDPANILEQYKMVKITEAELLGLPTPSFEGEPKVPGDMEAEKAPEPTADDPPTS